jgi:hypothetical protein
MVLGQLLATIMVVDEHMILVETCWLDLFLNLWAAARLLAPTTWQKTIKCKFDVPQPDNLFL